MSAATTYLVEHDLAWHRMRRNIFHPLGGDQRRRIQDPSLPRRLDKVEFSARV